jgi:hypothetical protein
MTKADVVTDDTTEALNALREGKTVSLGTVEEVNTLIKEMNDFVQEAKKKGEKVKLNLCQVSVPGTNLFCGSSLKDDQGKSIPRDKMPQLAGKPKPGSPAADSKKFPVDKEGEVNVGDAFVKYLAEKGVETREGSVPAAQLKASQSELKGKTVAFMMSPKGQKAVDLEEQSIFVSSDGYVIDGHHRWAATFLCDPNGKVEATQIDLPGVSLVSALNTITVGMFNRGGNYGDGDIKDFTGRNIGNLLDNFLKNGIQGKFPITPEQVKESLGNMPGAGGDYEKGKEIMM